MSKHATRLGTTTTATPGSIPQATPGTTPTKPLSLHNNEAISTKSTEKKRNSFSMVESGSQFLEGFKDFISTNTFVISAWYDYMSMCLYQSMSIANTHSLTG